MVLSDASGGDMGWRKWLIAAWAFMECLLFGGLMYGWSSIVFVLKDEGIYADLCPSQSSIQSNATVPTLIVDLNSTVVIGNNTEYGITSGNSTLEQRSKECKPQDSNMTLCFTIGSALFCAGCAVLGHVSYKFGTRVTRLISFVMFIAGALLMAFINKDAPWLMFPGLSLLGMGGIPLLVTNTQVSNLFLVGSSTVVGLLCGGFDMSSAVMLIVKLAYAGGFARRDMFLIIAGLHLLTLVSTFFFLPKDFIPRAQTKAQSPDAVDETEVSVELLSDKKAINAAEESAPSKPSLRSCLCKPVFITHVIWLCLLQLRFFFFIGTLNQYLNRLFKEDAQQVSYFTNMCFTIMMGGLVTSPLAGVVYDIVRRWCQDGKSSAYKEVFPAAIPQAVGSLLALLLSVLVLLPSTQVLYLTFIIMTVFRSFLFSMAAAFLSVVFPSEYFGLLYGVMIVSGGIFSFLQFAFFTWAEQYPEAPLHANILLLILANILLLILVCISFFHPLYLWITCSREEKKFKVN
ncbi:hypothetical protein DPMN_041277 [Dreissena polymorpha]|uniref:Solute carrier family 43 member 3 n=1 Tax=Dreissena polymorpha TaxID=45954 RepID=A0A9D4HW26_DREPO|nr:hypothetical protein DPMN_041277 [Dreissena polymorpha]